MYFSSYRLLKTRLDKCLKSPVSEERSASNTVNFPKHCSNLNNSTFTKFNDHCEGNSIEKSIS